MVGIEKCPSNANPSMNIRPFCIGGGGGFWLLGTPDLLLRTSTARHRIIVTSPKALIKTVINKVKGVISVSFPPLSSGYGDECIKPDGSLHSIVRRLALWALYGQHIRSYGSFLPLNTVRIRDAFFCTTDCTCARHMTGKRPGCFFLAWLCWAPVYV